MKKTLVIIVVSIFFIGMFLHYNKFRRDKAIDYLNLTKGANDWTKLDNDELRIIVKYFKAQENDIIPDEFLKGKAQEILLKLEKEKNGTVQ